MSLYKCEEWQGSSLDWYVNDVKNSNPIAHKWWIPLLILNISCEEYIKMLKTKFKAKDFNYKKESNVLIFSFSSVTDARKYKNYINRIAREKQFIL